MVECVDPDTLLEWLQTGVGEERDIQLMALEQLCMLLLMSDNIDRCFENCPPRNFLPALCRIILDETAPDNILEVTARAITYYLDVSQDVLKRILSVEGSVKGICNRLASADMNSRTSKDLAEQCVKILELICQRDADVVFQSGGLETMLNFVVNHGQSVHKDTFYSSMSVVSKLCTKIDPSEQSYVIETCTTRLSQLLKTVEDQNIVDNVLRCFVSISDRCVRKNVSTELLTGHGLIDHMIHILTNYNRNLSSTAVHSQETASPSVPGRQSAAHHPSCSIILNLVASLCRGSQKVTDDLLTTGATKLKGALQNMLSQKEERLLLDSLWFVDFILTILVDGRQTLSAGYYSGKSSTPSTAATTTGGALYLVGSTPTSRFYNNALQPESGSFSITDMDRTQRYLTECIRYKDTDSLIEAIENDGIDVNFTDDVGQTLLNWASAFGTVEMVEYLCDKGADVNKGQKSSSLHYAACFGRPQIAKILLRYGANPDLCDEEGKRPLDKARDRNDNGHREVTFLLENPGEWMQKIKPDLSTTQTQNTAENSTAEVAASCAASSSQQQPCQNLTPDYMKFLLPTFAQIYQKHNLNINLRRVSLQLIDKCLKRMDAKTLKEAADDHGFGQKLVEILSVVLDSEDEGGQHNALCMINEMLNKQSEYFADHFERLGVIPKIQSLCEQAVLSSEETLVKSEKSADRSKDLASSLLERHFKSNLSGQRLPVQKLHNIIECLLECINCEVIDGNLELPTIFRQSFTDLKHMLMDEDALSSYELYSSGLIGVLLTLAPYLCDDAPTSKDRKFLFAKQAFDDVFCVESSSTDFLDQKLDHHRSPLDILIRKLVTCLENAEKFPQYIYDSSSSGSHVPRPAFLVANGGYQMLNKRFRFTLEKNDEDDKIPDKSGRMIRAEALVTVGQLKTHLSRILSAQPITSDTINSKNAMILSLTAQQKNQVSGQTDRSVSQVTYATVTSFESGRRIPLAVSKLQPPTTATLATTSVSLINQKSMSTTNLFDNKDNKVSQQSTVTSNQAISAESLQNPTASLENLIARSRWREVQQPPLPEASCESPSTDAAEGESFSFRGDSCQTLASCQDDSQEMLSSHQSATVKYFRSRTGRKSMSSSGQGQEDSKNLSLNKGVQPKGRGRRYSAAGDVPGSANSQVSSIDESGEKYSQFEVDAGGMFKSFFGDAASSSVHKYLVTPCQTELNEQGFTVNDLETSNHPQSTEVAPEAEEQNTTPISLSTPNLNNDQKRPIVTAANEQDNPMPETSAAAPIVMIATPAIDSVAANRAKNLSISSSSDDEALQHLLDTFASLTARARQRPTSETIDPGLLNIGDLVELGGDLATSGEVLSLVKAAVQAELEACVNILPPLGSRIRNERKTIDSTAGNLETSTSSAANALASALSARRAQVLAEMDEDEYGDMPVGGPVDDDDPLSYEYDDLGAYGATEDDYANEEDEYYPAPPSQFADTAGFETLFSERASCRRRRNRHSAANSGSQDNAVNNDSTADGDTKFAIVQPGASSSTSLKFQQRLANHMLMNNKRKVGGAMAAAAVAGLGAMLEDDYVLKRQFEALLPAFDPRPGRSNVNQMQDVELPPTVEKEKEIAATATVASTQSEAQSRLHLKIGLQQAKDDEKSGATIPLTDDHKCLFYYIQQLVLQNVTSPKTNPTFFLSKVEKLKAIFDQTYIIFYETGPKKDDDKSQDLIDFSGSIIPETENKTKSFNDFSTTKLINTLQLLKFLRKLSPDNECSTSKKLTDKLRQQLRDVLVVAGDSLPDWCDRLMFDFPFLFPFDCRQMYLKSTAFGATRAISWLQSQSDQRLEQQRASSSTSSAGILRRTLEETHFFHDYRVGRIKHERVKVDRRDENGFLDWSRRVMDFHAERKSYLEVEFLDEEGTGLGPTLEFYALTAAQLQRKSLALWLCDDETLLEKNVLDKPVDLGSGLKPIGYYVRRAGGLFPAPYPQNCPQLEQVCKLFHFMGTFIAKVLQDGRLVDLPLSKPFLKFLCQSSDYSLNFRDFELLYPIKARFLQQLRKLYDKRREIFGDENLIEKEKQQKLEKLRLSINGCDVVDYDEVGSYQVEELGLTFQLNPPSQAYGYEYVNLMENGGSINVESQNLNDYIVFCTDFYLNSGIKLQLQAFKNGFDRVFPMDRLRSFSSEEIQTLISGEQYPKWTSEDIIAHTEPKLGYSKDSPGFLRFVEVLCEMTGEERKSFLQFTTGCSSLPPGGLMNLHPPLTIVRKVDTSDGSYPSVNTCVHYLKLPEYTSKEILKKRLLCAMREKGFHLN